MKVQVKLRDTEKSIEIEENVTIKTFKEFVASEFNVGLNKLCLVFAGKILQDEDTLAFYHIKDDVTVHVVIKSVSEVDTTEIDTDDDMRQMLLATFDFEAINIEDITFPELVGKAKEMFSQNPRLLNLVKRISIEYLKENPNVLYTILTGNPQIQELVERMPELNHILSNPNILRQAVEIVSKPALLQELVRTYDRALNNLESLPGGFNVLQHVYHTIEEPLFNLTEKVTNNDFINIPNRPKNPQQGTENKTPLPNPWANQPSKVDRVTPMVQDILAALNIQNVEEIFKLYLDKCKHSSGVDAVSKPTDNNSVKTSPDTPSTSEDQITAAKLLEQRFQRELEHLSTIGFGSADDNLRGLLLNDGDVEATIAWLTKMKATEQ